MIIELKRARPIHVEVVQVPEDYTARVHVARWCKGWTTPSGVAWFSPTRREEAVAGEYVVRTPDGFTPATAGQLASKYEDVL